MPQFIGQHDLPVTASGEASVRVLDQFGDALLGFSTKADCIVGLADSDPDCPLAQAYAAQFFASGETNIGMARAQPYLNRARMLAPSATMRERAIIEAAGHWCATERRRAAHILETVLDDHPTDIVTAKWAQALHFDTGNAAGILRAPLKVAGACDGNAYVHGMLAFGYEECHILDSAERAVHRAVALRRDEPWAHHAMAHICEARNQMDRGLSFLVEVSDTWTGLTSFMTTHNWWHVCLFLVDLDRADEALAQFDRIVWAMDQTNVQDQINAISLLYRLERTGIDVGDRWSGIARCVVPNAHSQVSVFLDFQFLYALARADHPEATDMMQRMILRAQTATEDECIAWEKVAVPAAPGIVALARGDYPAAIRQISQARPWLQCIGGSHAQRELFSLFYIDALRGAGEWEKVQLILAQRHRARPRTSWIREQLREAYQHLGLAGAVTV
jgi:hypothetical protein